MKAFHLQILCSDRPFYDGDCLSLVVPISDGMIGIMAGHYPMTAAILDGEVVMTLPEGEKRRCAVTRGILDVSADRVRLLCVSALAPEEIDERKARKEQEEAELLLREKRARRDYVQAKLAFAKAVNSLMGNTERHYES